MSGHIYNTIKSDDSDAALNETFRFAGHDPYYERFGKGAWYGKAIATVAISRDFHTAVIAWQHGYVRGANEPVEKEIREYIEKHIGE